MGRFLLGEIALKSPILCGLFFNQRVFEPDNVDVLCRELMAMENDPRQREHYRKKGLVAAKRYDRRTFEILREIAIGRPQACTALAEAERKSPPC